MAVRREVRRDEVVDLLWRGVDEDRARNAFRQALHRLRAAVGDDVLPQDRELLRLVPGASLAIDLDRFESAIANGRLVDALDACGGDFLERASLGEPPFDMWVEQERTRLRARLAQVLADATAQSSAAGRWAEAVARVNRLMAVAPFESSSAHLAATTLIAAGRRHEARELLKQFAATLDSELGLPLPSELQALLARLERQAPTPAGAGRAQPALSAPEALPFVGRETELTQLVTLCRTTEGEFGGIALVTGGEGIGKSRLLVELVAHLRSLGRMTVLHGREHVAGVQLPYAVFAEALRPLARAPGIVGASRHLLAEAARLLPELRDEMELPLVSDVEDEAGRLRFFEGIAALMDAAAFERPIVLVVDDVHLAGPSTLELLLYLVARLARSAVTFVLALRSDDAPASLLSRLESVARPDSPTHPGRSIVIELGPLSAADAQRVLGDDARAGAIAESAIADVVAGAAGIPARLVDLRRRVLRGEPIAAAPVGTRDATLDRAARLSSVQRRLLFVIALLGRTTERDIAGRAAHLPDAAVGDAVEALLAEGLIEVRSGGLLEMQDGTRRAVLDLAGPSTRAFLSGWIADELATRASPPAELARFYAAAGQPTAAFEQSRLAAFAALRVGAVPEATHHLQVARAYASGPEDLANIESLLSAIGAGRRQIPTAPPAPIVESRPSRPRRSSAATARLEALFPNWRGLLGAAVATLTVSSLVLADRARSSSAGIAVVTEDDTLLVAEDANRRSLRAVTGNMSVGFSVGPRTSASALPPWIDSLPRQWTNAIPAPNGQRVAVERVAQHGSDLFLISADRRDTTSLLLNAGEAHGLGWSPDSRWVLASLSSGPESFESGLFAFRDDDGAPQRYVIDAAPGRLVVEAAWSPDGTHIAWVSRVGAERQLEVFVGNADGSGMRNVSRHPADDRHIAWSPDGTLLAFTSNRDGNAELYALSFLEDRLWRLTSDPAQDDRAQFSTDGRLLAFESTRGGSAAVYVMPALGGALKRVHAPTPVSVVRWSGRPARYVERILIEQPGRIRRADTVALRVVALDQFDEPLAISGVEWRVLDTATARAIHPFGEELRITPRGAGLARISATVRRWRFDTAHVALGEGPIALLRNDGAQQRFWRPLGDPRPAATAAAITLQSDREWDSGVLSRESIPLMPGLVLQTSLQLRFADVRDAVANVGISFVAPEDSSTIDAEAPQFLRYASMSWNAESGRLVYGVGREFFSEPAAALASDESLPVQLRIEADSTMSFVVAGRLRWRSSLRVVSPRTTARAQVWISSRATGDKARLSGTSIRIDPVPVSSR